MSHFRLFLCAVLTIVSVIQTESQAQDIADVDAERPASEEEVPEVDESTEESGSEENKREWHFNGYASEEYRFRHSTNLEVIEIDPVNAPLTDADTKPETDQDLRLFLSGYLWESSDHFVADLSMGLWYDLDGTSEAGQPTSFGEVNDYEAPQSWHDPYDIYSGYLEYHSGGLLALTRLGRQTSEHGRFVTFDGATIKLSPFRPYFDLVLFGGRSSHFFKLSNSLFEDWVGSAVAVIRPVQNWRVELDYRYTSEDTLDQAGLDNHSYGLISWFRFPSIAQLRGFIRGLDDAMSNAGGAAMFDWPEKEFGFEASVDSQLNTLREINEREDPYFSILGQSLPHLRASANVWKNFTTDAGIYGITLGANDRFLIKDDETQFNRNYAKAYLLVEATDIGMKGPFMNAVVDYHFTHPGSSLSEDTQFTLGGALGYEWKRIRATLGSYYYKYKYDYYVDINEVEDVRSYFGSLRYKMFDWLTVRLRYEFEQFDRDIHTVTLRLTQTN